jgi:hypothetical protein
MIPAIDNADAVSRREAANSGIRGAQQKVHVISGNLRASIKILAEGRNATRFGSEIRYAGIEEFRPGHSYLMPEYNRLQTFYPEAFVSAMRRFL